MIFDFFQKYNAKPVQMTPEIFLGATTETPDRVRLYKLIAQCTDDEQRQKLKKLLPAVTWQAHFPDGKRSNATAVWSGLYIMDIDDIDDADKVAAKLMSLIKPCQIVVMHKTPSGHGLRIVAVAQKGLASIQANQEALAERILEILPELADKIDRCVKDSARLSYLPIWSYFYYFDGSIWTREPDPEILLLAGNGGGNAETSQPVGQSAAASKPQNAETSSTERGEQTGRSEMQNTFDGIPLMTIAEKLLELRGGHPQKGERNTRLYELALRMRYIAEFDPFVIAANIPHCDLGDSEILGLCRSACTAARASALPTDLRMALAALKHPEGIEESEEAEEDILFYANQLPPLPIGLHDSLIGQPDKVKMAVLCGVLPLAMAYATDVTVRYADGNIQRLNLMSVIYGQQASGKSSVKRAIDIWKKPMQESDQIQRREEDKFRELKRNRSANEKLPQEPRRVIRIVPITVSCSTLLKRMKNADGKHVYSFGEELDTLRKTNAAGSWSQKYDIYRLAFDNGEWGQDYNSDNAESGVVEVAYNLGIMGTLGAVKRSFRDDSIENGMSGRILFAKMPSSQYEHMPKFGAGVSLSDAYLQEQQILKAVEILQSCKGFVDTPILAEEICTWCDRKADEARLNKDKIVDTFRKRAAVIGFRCGVLYQLLENGGNEVANYIESQHSIDFALLMAEYAMQNQIELFGDQLLTLNVQHPTKGASHKILDKLPDVFSYDMLQEIFPEKPYQTLRNEICRWKKEGFIVAVGTNIWKKK